MKFRPVRDARDRHWKLNKGYAWVPERHIDDPVQRIFAHIHYLVDHAPIKTRARWKQAKIRWNMRMLWWKAGINRRL